MHDVMPRGFRGARQIARALRIVETEIDLFTARARLEPDARFRPRQRTAHAAEIELGSHTRSHTPIPQSDPDS